MIVILCMILSSQRFKIEFIMGSHSLRYRGSETIWYIPTVSILLRDLSSSIPIPHQRSHKFSQYLDRTAKKCMFNPKFPSDPLFLFNIA